MTIEVFYDPLGNIVATPDLHLNGAWVIQHSTKYENRCFFFNTETQATAWCLPPHILGLPAMQTSHSFSSNSSNANSNSVNQIPSLSQNKPFQKNEKEEEDTEPLEPIPPNPTKPISNSSIKNGGSGGGGGGGGLPSIFTPKKILTTSKSTTQLPDISPKSNIRHSVSDPNASQSFLSLDSPISSPASSPKIISSSLSSSPTTSPSTTPIIPKFKVIEGLGRGGYATVVKVQDIYSKKYYAMKVIIKNTSKNYNKRIKHQEILDGELKVMTDIIPSPFLQKCYYSFENPITVFFILELHTGGDLYHHLVQRTKKGKSFSEKEIKIILSELYLAIEHLHKNKIIHRDIKVENVMLDGNGHVKLVDFGLAVTLTHEVQPMSALGSLIYMAPELIFEKTGGRHTDWWAYGILAHELLTGSSPWSSLTNTKTIRKEIKSGIINPYGCSSTIAKEFIISLLNRDVPSRLGTKSDIEIKLSSFFKSIAWDKTEMLKSNSAFIPYSKSGSNVSYEDQSEALESYYDMKHSWEEIELTHDNMAQQVENNDGNQADEGNSSLEQQQQQQKKNDTYWYLGLERADKYLASSYN